jgi:PAS domain S-box-containing protein
VTENQIDSDEAATLETLSADELRSLIQDLRTRNIELERQNEAWGLAADDTAIGEKRLRIFLENSYDVLFTLDTEGGFSFASPTWERHFGYPVSDILGKNFASMVHPHDAASCRDYLQTALSGAHSRVSPPYRVKHADGTWLWFETNGMPFVDTNGSLMFTGAARNITERKLAEAIMEARLRLLQCASSHSLSELLRSTLDEAEVLTGSLVGFFHILAADQTSLSLQAWSTNTTQHFCTAEASGHFIVRKSGIWNDCIRKRKAVINNDCTSSARKKRLPHGHAQIVRELVVPVIRSDKIVALMGVGNKSMSYDELDIDTVTSLADLAWDIAESKRKEESLMASNARFDQLAEQSRTFAWEVDATGLYTYISHVAEDVIGYRPDELVNRMHFYDLFPEAERESLMTSIFKVFEQQGPFKNHENSIISKDGRTVHVSTNCLPILSIDGTLLGYQGSDTDISEQKILKEQLIQSQKMEAVGQLAGGLAHDFNNVLSIINGFCCLLNMDIGPDEQLKEYVDRIIAASSRAGELTHSMLAFSRTQIMNPKNQDLNFIATNVGSFIKRIIGEDIQLISRINVSSLLVNVDAGQIEQLLLNLVTNARDAMPDGGKLTIATNYTDINDTFISAHGFGEPGPYAVLTVSDNGEGMSDDTIQKIFEPFYTTKMIGKGTGLGLAMVYGIAKQHNGFVDVVSEPEKGASFSVYLPIAVPGNTGSGIHHAADVETSGGDETILIAEDDDSLREFLHKILTRLGYRTILAVDGQEAVDRYKENAGTIQLTIMDMVMPHKSGKQAYDEIRQIAPNAKALFSSGYNAKFVQMQKETGGEFDFLPKPVQPAELLKKIRQILDRKP